MKRGKKKLSELLRSANILLRAVQEDVENVQTLVSEMEYIVRTNKTAAF